MLSLSILGQRVRVECDHNAAHALLQHNFEAMSAPEDVADSDLRYCIEARKSQSGFALTRDCQPAFDCEDLDDVLFQLERDLVVELQKRRADLFFLHAACLERNGRACLLAAESGSGKSTTAWGLLHHGFRYFSDELGPVELNALRVSAYPHALKLRSSPAQPYQLPKEAIHLSHTIHIPARHLPEAAVTESLPLGAVFLLTHRPELCAPDVRILGPAEASARLYVNALNALAHSNRGLDAVVQIAERVPCFALVSTELATTCAAISTTVEQVLSSR